MTQSSRRHFLKTSALGAATIAGTSGISVNPAQAQENNLQSTIHLKANEISQKLK